jgi:hypothetical protein
MPSVWNCCEAASRNGREHAVAQALQFLAAAGADRVGEQLVVSAK